MNNLERGLDSETIVLRADGGSLDGVVHHQADRVATWLDSQFQGLELAPLAPCAIIKSMYVDPERRGKGVGRHLLQRFDHRYGHFQAYVEADLRESNAFDLVRWYKRRGFRVLHEAPDSVLLGRAGT